ncbi:MAG: signal peptidase I [Bryobacterales bacterium]|nr:signal peptidase I [Bryobacterales bacterium]
MSSAADPEVPTPPSADHLGTRAAIAAAVGWLRDLLLAVIILVLVIQFIYRPVKVEGTSMQPSLEDQDRIFINKFIYQFGMGDIGRGDTVVFSYPGDPSKSYIKRIIGLPGDRVTINEGQVSVNGALLTENYVPPAYRDTQTIGEVIVPPDCYYVLGDHRSSSNDSRSWGPVHRRHIFGKAVFVYWPLDKMGLIR